MEKAQGGWGQHWRGIQEGSVGVGTDQPAEESTEKLQGKLRQQGRWEAAASGGLACRPGQGVS